MLITQRKDIQHSPPLDVITFFNVGTYKHPANIQHGATVPTLKCLHIFDCLKQSITYFRG